MGNTGRIFSTLLLSLFLCSCSPSATQASALPQSPDETVRRSATPSPTPSRTSYEKVARAKLPDAPKGLTIHGMFPGLYRSEVERQFGGPVRSGKTWAIYSDGNGSTFNVYYRSEIVMGVDGNQVEYEGQLLGASGRDFPGTRPGLLGIERDHNGIPFHFELHDKDLRRIPIIPAPGSSVKLLEAWGIKDPEKGRDFIRKNPEILQGRWNGRGRTVLHFNARGGTPEGTRLCLELGADPNARTFQWQTPLHNVSSAEKAAILLEGGADINAVNKYGQTPLAENLGEGRGETALYLLSKGADIEGERGEQAMREAARGRLPHLVSALLERGVTPPPDALIHAARGGHPEIVELFLDMGQDPNVRDKYGRTPLHHAVADGNAKTNCSYHAEAMRILLSRGADPSLRDNFKKTPSDEVRVHKEAEKVLADYEKS